jgi:hypothetical protein
MMSHSPLSRTAWKPQIAIMRALFLCAAGLFVCALGACGGPASDTPSDTTSGTPTGGPVQWMTAKPNPFVGSLRAAVVERTAPDRARIEAHWRNDKLWPGCVVELVLPDGVIAVDGAMRHEPQADEISGMASWEVEFPSGRPLDAVIRYCIETPEGVRATQLALRLTD